MKTKILLVDDEKDIVEFLKYNLEKENFEVYSAYDGEDALKKLSVNPDLIILDIMMPKLNGFEVCKKIRNNKEYENIPVIFLTAKSSEVDEVLGLEIGGSDFIQKPISPQKLVARVKSNLRNKQFAKTLKKENQILEIGPLTINREKYIVKLNKQEIVFPRKEFELLAFLAGNPGKVFSREALLKNIWGSDVYVVERTVDVHIRKIREKLEKSEDLIETIKGVGYRFKDF